MRSIGLEALEKKLSAYVRLAAGGETVLITDRDRVVAELTPPSARRSPVLQDARLVNLVRQGLLTPPICAPGALLPARVPVAKLADLLAEFRRDRDER